MSELTTTPSPPAGSRSCPTCGRPHEEHRKSKAVAVVLNLAPGPFAILGLHRIYLGMRSGWLMIPGFYVAAFALMLGYAEVVHPAATLLMLFGGATACVVHIVDLFRIFLGGLRPEGGWRS